MKLNVKALPAMLSEFEKAVKNLESQKDVETMERFDNLAPDLARLAISLYEQLQQAQTTTRAPATLDALTQIIENRGWNWEVSCNGQNPDGSWQYEAHIWSPLSFRPDIMTLGKSAVDALAVAYGQSKALMGDS